MVRDPDSPRPRWSRPPVLAGLLLVVVLLIAAGIDLGRGGSTPRANPAPTVSTTVLTPATTEAATTEAPTTAATHAPSRGPVAETCPPLHSDSTTPTAPPAGLTWRSTTVGLLPSSPTDGPAVHDHGIDRCFSHTPTGAVLAAVTINLELLMPSWSPAMNNQVLHNDGYDQLLTGYQANPPDGTAPPNTITGFRVLSYLSSTATVSLVLIDTAGSALQDCPTTLAWTNNDWLISPLPNGHLSATCTTTQEGSFVSWNL